MSTVDASAPNPPAGFVRRALRRGEWRLLAIIVGLFLLRDLPWRLDEYDQAKQAFTSLEMVQAGHWGFQHTPGYRAVATKPPLVGWISAGLYYLTGGNWELAWRLPSLLAALALVGLLWRAGEILWPGWGGTLAAGAFALNQLAPRIAALVRTDMPLTLWITLVGLIVWRHARGYGGNGLPVRSWSAAADTGRPGLSFLEGGDAWRTFLRGLSPDRWAVFFLLLAAMMTKGPVVYAFLLPGMAAYSLILRFRAKNDPAAASTLPGIWGGWWHWVLPLVPFLFWLERGMVTVPGFYQQVVLKEFLGRFTVGEAAVHHNQPVYFYFGHLLGRWAPWSILLLAVRVRGRNAWWNLWRDPGHLWLVCWAAGGLILLSLVPSKRVDRIFPVIPPLCLLVVAALRRAEEAGSDPREAVEGMLPADAPSVPVAAPVPLPPPAWPRQWSYLALRLGIALGIGGAVWGAGQAYWKREDTLARFGARVREATAGKPFGLVAAQPKASDETLLVYLRKLEFLTPVQALQFWTTGRADALVMSQLTKDLAAGLLVPAAVPLDQPVASIPARDDQPAYLLAVRGPEAPPLTVPSRPAALSGTPSPHKERGRKKTP